ncbi:COG4223 family protein [Paracoccus mutanolyticus]|uniref:COG4223 family protein n=1 Tax=Paracoccus mutanolyticus TaxID=1499308 RepID=UPI0011AE1B10|nr:hypothetical protein [Paracoccus mutanolyticus]
MNCAAGWTSGRPDRGTGRAPDGRSRHRRAGPDACLAGARTAAKHRGCEPPGPGRDRRGGACHRLRGRRAARSGAGRSGRRRHEVPEVLKGEIPRLVQLRAEFPAAARAGLRASLDAVAESEGTMGLIGNFLRVQTGARSVEPREGSDPDAILSRANAAVEAGAIATALDEIATLPQSGQNAMKSWTDRARIWVDANTALAELAAGGR